jgi:Holliday junction resolvasome RuvABC endonuclease subunit
MEESKAYIDNTRILFLDPSSSCLGFCMMQVDYNRHSAEILSAGPLWFGSDWNEGKKLRYIFSAIRNYFFILNQGVSEIVCEDYFFPMGKNAKVMGSLVVPGIIGVACLAAADEDPALDFTKISAQQWRKILNISPDKSDHPTEKQKSGKPKVVKDFKTPVERYVKTLITLPEEFVSNITGKSRAMPNDVTDVIGMASAVLKERGIQRITASQDWDKKHLTKGMF